MAEPEPPIPFGTPPDDLVFDSSYFSPEKTEDSEKPSSVEEEVPDPPMVAKPRTVILHKILFQKPFEEAEGADNSFTFWNQSAEEPFTRKFKAVEEWKPIYCDLLRDVPCILIITNEEKFLTGYNPTAEEIKLIAGRIIEVGYRMPIPLRSLQDQRKRPSESARTMWDESDVSKAADKESASVVSIAWIPPGEDLRFNPVSLSSLSIRCLSDSAKFTLHLIPR